MSLRFLPWMTELRKKRGRASFSLEETGRNRFNFDMSRGAELGGPSSVGAGHTLEMHDAAFDRKERASLLDYLEHV